MSLINNACGCKGIRSCLVCETDSTQVKISSDERELLFFNYCSHCNLCIPENTTTQISSALYLGRIKLIPDFISAEEEAFLVSSIDELPWMSSQSGRKKQDFGPKVNFKKKKVKIGNFKGFPSFTKDLTQRLQTEKDLMDFQPVELCHLEYVPDRGSSIAPHIDDFWLWGERLVTINLRSGTVLTLTPTDTGSCAGGPENISCFYKSSYANTNSCGHELEINSPNGFKYFCSALNLNSFINYKIEVRIALPPRSLFILAGCARRNWLHEIKRSDVVSRRLAMTYRELSLDFALENDHNKNISNSLLELGKKFSDIKIDKNEIVM